MDRNVEFQSTLPVGGATPDWGDFFEPIKISIHAPRGGSDIQHQNRKWQYHHFNPRSPWGERPGVWKVDRLELLISIHAPRGGSDKRLNTIRNGEGNFNPRSPWGERLQTKIKQDSMIVFQSTLPVGGATQKFQSYQKQERFQSTLPVGGATHIYTSFQTDTLISIHAPRGGSDLVTTSHRGNKKKFQSTLPVGGATRGNKKKRENYVISIHAPRGGSDYTCLYQRLGQRISIHAPRGGSDWGLSPPHPLKQHFNPRSPWGERLSRPKP